MDADPLFLAVTTHGDVRARVPHGGRCTRHVGEVVLADRLLLAEPRSAVYRLERSEEAQLRIAVHFGARMARLPGDPPSGLTQPQVTPIIIFIVAAILLRFRLRRAVSGA